MITVLWICGIISTFMSSYALMIAITVLCNPAENITEHNIIIDHQTLRFSLIEEEENEDESVAGEVSNGSIDLF